jgi:hypothetical protein
MSRIEAIDRVAWNRLAAALISEANASRCTGSMPGIRPISAAVRINPSRLTARSISPPSRSISFSASSRSCFFTIPWM